MTPKDKAEELKEKCDGYACYAEVAIDEIIDSYTKEKSYGYIISDKIIPYWEEVKKEI
jgi:hypothetical protein